MQDLIVYTLYRVRKANGQVDITIQKPQGEYELAGFRVEAHEGKALTQDGINLTPCIDTETIDGLYEVTLENLTKGDD